MKIDINKIQLTPHFSLRECIFGTNDFLLKQLGSEADLFIEMVVKELTEEIIEELRIVAMEHENFRAACGNKPINVLCGFRPLAWDRHKGRKYTSAHTKGQALDTNHSVMSLANYYAAIEKLAHTGGRAINPSMNFVHKDTFFSKDQIKRTWSY